MEGFKKVWKEADKRVKDELGYGLSQALTWTGVSGFVWTRALVNARRKHWLPAIFYAVLWHGYTANINATIEHKQARLRDQHPEGSLGP